MKQYSVFVQMANNRYCHDLITSENDTPEKIKEAYDKSIEIANEILSRYKGEGLYCFVYVHDEEFNIIYENDNVTYTEEKQGDQTSLAEITKQQRKVSCYLADGPTKDGNKKFLEYIAELKNDGNVRILYKVYVCDKSMIQTIKQRVSRQLDTSITYYNSL